MSRPATTRLKVNPQIGRRPTLQNCRLDELLVDESYQRSIENKSSEGLIRRIAQFWDWSLCQPLVVSQREGGLYVVDGQHRLAAAIMRGDISDLPCVINAYGTAAEEAASFVAINKQRRGLNAVDVFRASLSAGDTDAKAVADLISDAGLSIAPHQNHVAWRPGMIYCIPTVQSAYRRHGRLVASSALCALSEAFDGQVLRYAGNLLSGLFQFYASELREEAFDADSFIEELGRHSQVEWVRRALAQMSAAGCSKSSAMHTVLTQAYLGALTEALAA
jgi:hypothetical protein